ncbi:MAG: chondroitinase family protein, partial [Ginsengibacter sp.]
MCRSLYLKNILFSFSLFLGFVLTGQIVSAQIPDICEGTVPGEWQTNNGNLSISHAHFKAGKESVLWKWNKPNSSIIITDTAFASAANEPRSSFVIWIYNEKPVNDKLLFEF